MDQVNPAIPVWMLASSKQPLATPFLEGADSLSGARLAEMRAALAALSDSPVVTLEAHPIDRRLDRGPGIPLDAVSPLAQHLAQLVSQSAKSAPAAANVQAAGEVLYRVVIPAKVAAEVGSGLVRPMASSAVAGGIHSAMVSTSGIAAQATFVPVASQAAAAGAAGGAAGTAGIAAAGAGALTVAAPLILMAIAVGVSAHADHKRQIAIERITELLEQLHMDKLDAERSELDGCRDAIDKATAVLLDQGKIGASLGLDSAVHAIGKATEQARYRLRGWRAALEGLPAGAVEVKALSTAFPGIEGDGGEFRAHLELASLAITLKRRVLVLQAVEHSQSAETNPFENFVKSLRTDQQRVDELEAGIALVLLQLSSLELRAPTRIWETLMPRGEVNDLMKTFYRLREFSRLIESGDKTAEVVIEIERHADGSLLVLPAKSA